MKIFFIRILYLGLLFSGLTTPANAALESRLNGQAVYDTDLDITWLADANYAMTSGYNLDGRMTWDEAKIWIDTLNAANHLGFNDWRLPTTLISDSSCTTDTTGSSPSPDSTGYNCTGSEMGHLFYNELGATAGSSLLISGDPDLALFTNIQTDLYWSDTEYVPDLNQAWFFFTSNGYQSHTVKNISPFSWAVRSGNAGKNLFTDVATVAGITHVSSMTADNFAGGGTAWIDIDNDGLQDLFVPNPEAGQPNRLYHNVGGSFIEIGFSAGVQDSIHQAAGAVVGDYDNDGCDDLLIVNGGGLIIGASERNTLYRNNFCDTGNPLTFSDTTIAANLHNEVANSIVASFGDLDQDGDLDLYVGNYTPDGAIAGFCEQNHYYRNNGNGNFTEQSISANLADVGCALGLVMSDYDNDGDLDVYITNDFSDPTSPAFVPGTADIFYTNQGTDASGNLLPFTTPANNLADATNGMGIAVGDIDNDGDLDYYATSFANNNNKQNVLNLNNGNATFTETSDAMGIGDRLDTSSIGWGVVFFDADHDGDLDIYKANGRIQELGFGTVAEMTQPNRFFKNDGNSFPSFTESANEVGFDGQVSTQLCWNFGSEPCYDQSRGVAAADYDNDGDIDLFVINAGQRDSSLTNPLIPQPPRLYQNNAASHSGGVWLKIQLEGRYNNRRGIGARIRVSSTSSKGSITQLREILSGSSHGSTDAFPAHFGFPPGSTITQLVVEWPAIRGQAAVVTAISSQALNQTITIEEAPDTDGDGIPDSWELLNNLNPGDPADALLDNDSDGLNNLGEFIHGTDLNNSDTDGDFVMDGIEIYLNTEPLNPASFPFNTVLAFDAGIISCVLNLGTPPDNCSAGIEINTGSYMNSSDTVLTPLTPGPDGGIYLGTVQSASQTHTGCPDGSEIPGLDNSWCFFGATGVLLTTSPITIISSVGQTMELDFSGWALEWNGNPVNSLGGDFINYPSDTGVAILTCSITGCPNGSTFNLDYTSHGDPNNSGFFGANTVNTFHFEGAMNNTASAMADGDINLDGSVNIIDVLLATKALLGLQVLTAEQLQHANVAPIVNNVPAPDGTFNTADLMIISRKAMELINF